VSTDSDSVLLRNGLLADGTRSDILVRDGKIAEPAGADEITPTVIDLAGRLVLPALIDAHVHLDKTLLGLPWQPHRAENSTRGRIEAEKEMRRTLKPDVERCGAALLSLALENGTTAVRSHVDIDDVTGLRHVEALLRLREAWRDLVDIQLVAFPQSGIKQCAGVAELLRDALAMGCDLVGGLDPIGIDGDLGGHLDTIFALAERYAVGVDIHLHDQGEEGLGEILAIADRTKALGLSGRVTVSHAFCLGSVSPERAAGAADRLASAGVTILTSAPGAAAMPPISLLRKAGVRVVAGSDNVRDAWSPLGNASMLERCWLVAYRCGYRTDEDIGSTFDLATANAAALLGLDRELKPGRTADLIVLPQSTLAQAIIERPRPDLVLRRGRVVHRTAGA
jgi:cytosine deaminase